MMKRGGAAKVFGYGVDRASRRGGRQQARDYGEDADYCAAPAGGASGPRAARSAAHGDGRKTVADVVYGTEATGRVGAFRLRQRIDYRRVRGSGTERMSPVKSAGVCEAEDLAAVCVSWGAGDCVQCERGGIFCHAIAGGRKIGGRGGAGVAGAFWLRRGGDHARREWHERD